jgi:antitoxin VapB
LRRIVVKNGTFPRVGEARRGAPWTSQARDAINSAMPASTKRKQLNIRSDEAVQIAHRLVRKTGMTATEVVVDALRRVEAAGEVDKAGLTPDQLDDYLALRALSKKYAALVVPGSTSDHDDLYDENGVPK